MRLCCIFALAVSAWGASSSCSSSSLSLSGDITLSASDTISWATCVVTGNGFKISGSTTGNISIIGSTITGLGSAGVAAISTTQTSTGTFIFTGNSIDTSGFISATRNGSGSTTVSGNTVAATNVFYWDACTGGPAVQIFGGCTNDHRTGGITIAGTSTAGGNVRGNVILRGWVQVTACGNWIIGEDPVSPVESDSNIIAGVGAGVIRNRGGCALDTSVINHNFIHTYEPSNDLFWSWQQTGMLQATSGTVTENNVTRGSQWPFNGMAGDIHDNVILDADGHSFIRNPVNSINVYNNIVAGRTSEQNRYGNCCLNGIGGYYPAPAILENETSGGNSPSFYNNVVDTGIFTQPFNFLETIQTDVFSLFATGGASQILVRDSVFLNIHNRAGWGAIAPATGTEGSSLARLVYADYNLFTPDTSVTGGNNYGNGSNVLTVTSGSSCAGTGYFAHDIGNTGSCPNKYDNRAFTTFFNGPRPKGFPYAEADIIARTVTVSTILDFYRYVYGPKSAGPLVGAGSTGNDIGAVQLANLPSAPPANLPPVVYAGLNQSVPFGAQVCPQNGQGNCILGTAWMQGDVSDDGNGGTLTAAWSTVIAPGGCTISGGNTSCVTYSSFGGGQGNPLARVNFTTAGTYVLRLTANDGTLSTSADVTLTVGSSPVDFSPNFAGSSITLLNGLTYSIKLAGTGGTPPYLFNNLATSLPTGLSFNTTTGVLSGTPTVNGTATIKFTIADSGAPLQQYSARNVVINVVSMNSHPRLFTSAQIASMVAKVAANDADWVTTIKPRADADKSLLAPAVTITTCTNANPMVCTSASTLPIATTSTCYLIGGAGGWAPLNDIGTPKVCTKTSATTFSVPVDSSGYGAYGAQAVVVWMRDGLSAGYSSYEFEGAHWNQEWQDLALAYLATSDASYCTAGKVLLDYVNGLSAVGFDTPMRVDSGYPSRNIAIGVGYFYDACYSTLSSGQKAATAVTEALWYNWAAANASYVTYPPSNYWGGHIAGFGLMCLATHGDDSNAPTCLNWVRTNFNIWGTANSTLGGMSQMFVSAATGNTATFSSPASPPAQWASGYENESYNYSQGQVGHVEQYMAALKNAYGEHLIVNSGYLQLFARNILYNLKPDRWRSTVEGVWSGTSTGVMGGTWPLRLGYEALLGTTEGGWMQWMYNHFGTAPADGPNQLGTVEDRFLLYDSTLPGIDYRTAQNPYFFSSSGIDSRVYWRDDWTDSATYVMFGASPVYLPGVLSAGGLELQRGADALINYANFWNGATGASGTQYIADYGGIGGEWVSSLYFDDGGAYCLTGANYNGCANKYGGWAAPTVVQSANYQYAGADLSQTYQITPPNDAARTLTSFYRVVSTMGDGTVFVWDQAKSTSSAYAKTLRFHMSFQNAPSITGGVVSQVTGASKIYVAPFSVDALSVTTPQDVFNSVSSVYRTDVTTTSASTDLNVLTVLYATGSGTSFPASAALTSDANHYAVQVADTVPKVVAMPVGLTLLGRNYAPTSHTSATLTSTHSGTGHYLVSGMAAGTYSVTGPTTTSCTVGSDGTCYFSGASGAYTIGSGGTPGTTISGKTTIGGNARRN